MEETVIKDFRFQQFQHLFIPGLISSHVLPSNKRAVHKVIAFSNLYGILVVPSERLTTESDKKTKFSYLKASDLVKYFRSDDDLNLVVSKLKANKSVIHSFELAVGSPIHVEILQEFLVILSEDGNLWQVELCNILSGNNVNTFKLVCDSVKEFSSDFTDFLGIVKENGAVLIYDLENSGLAEIYGPSNERKAVCLSSFKNSLYISFSKFPFLEVYDIMDEKLTELNYSKGKELLQMFALDEENLLLIPDDSMDTQLRIFNHENESLESFDDPTFASRSEGMPTYYLSRLPDGGVNPASMNWIAFLTASTSPDISVIGKRKENPNIEIWLLDRDEYMATYPLADDFVNDEDKNDSNEMDTFCQGFALDFTNMIEIRHPSGDPQDAPLPPAPLLWTVNTKGWLACYQLVNLDFTNRIRLTLEPTGKIIRDLTASSELVESENIPELLHEHIRPKVNLLDETCSSIVEVPKSINDFAKNANDTKAVDMPNIFGGLSNAMPKKISISCDSPCSAPFAKLKGSSEIIFSPKAIYDEQKTQSNVLSKLESELKVVSGTQAAVASELQFKSESEPQIALSYDKDSPLYSILVSFSREISSIEKLRKYFSDFIENTKQEIEPDLKIENLDNIIQENTLAILTVEGEMKGIVPGWFNTLSTINEIKDKLLNVIRKTSPSAAVNEELLAQTMNERWLVREKKALKNNLTHLEARFNEISTKLSLFLETEDSQGARPELVTLCKAVQKLDDQMDSLESRMEHLKLEKEMKSLRKVTRKATFRRRPRMSFGLVEEDLVITASEMEGLSISARGKKENANNSAWLDKILPKKIAEPIECCIHSTAAQVAAYPEWEAYLRGLDLTFHGMKKQLVQTQLVKSARPLDPQKDNLSKLTLKGLPKDKDVKPSIKFTVPSLQVPPPLFQKVNVEKGPVKPIPAAISFLPQEELNFDNFKATLKIANSEQSVSFKSSSIGSKETSPFSFSSDFSKNLSASAAQIKTHARNENQSDFTFAFPRKEEQPKLTIESSSESVPTESTQANGNHFSIKLENSLLKPLSGDMRVADSAFSNPFSVPTAFPSNPFGAVASSGTASNPFAISTTSGNSVSTATNTRNPFSASSATAGEFSRGSSAISFGQDPKKEACFSFETVKSTEVVNPFVKPTESVNPFLKQNTALSGPSAFGAFSLNQPSATSNNTTIFTFGTSAPTFGSTAPAFGSSSLPAPAFGSAFGSKSTPTSTFGSTSVAPVNSFGAFNITGNTTSGFASFASTNTTSFGSISTPSQFGSFSNQPGEFSTKNSSQNQNAPSKSASFTQFRD